MIFFRKRYLLYICIMAIVSGFLCISCSKEQEPPSENSSLSTKNKKERHKRASSITKSAEIKLPQYKFGLAGNLVGDTQKGNVPINIEYAYRIYPSKNGLPVREIHFRWFTGKLRRDKNPPVISNPSKINWELKETPVFRWRVFSDGKPVAWMLEEFQGILPEQEGEWGIGIKQEYDRSWANIFSFDKEAPQAINKKIKYSDKSASKARKIITNGFELRDLAIISLNLNAPKLTDKSLNNVFQGKKSDKKSRPSLKKIDGVMDDFDDAWEKVEDNRQKKKSSGLEDLF